MVKHDDITDAVCPRCGASMTETHHPACRNSTGQPTACTDQDVMRIVQEGKEYPEYMLHQFMRTDFWTMAWTWSKQSAGNDQQIKNTMTSLSRIPYTRPSITDMEIRYATDAAICSFFVARGACRKGQCKFF